MFVLVFLITLLILVLIHELGHFLMAKRFNIKVLEFGFGIPPKAIGKKIGETIYSLNWLPVGGFVRLLGEDEVDKDLLRSRSDNSVALASRTLPFADAKRKKILDEWNERSFMAQKVWKRILVVVAGVAMNLFLAWLLLYVVIIYSGFKIVVPSLEPSVIISRVEADSPASQAGLRENDKVIAFGDKFIKDDRSFVELVEQSGGSATSIVVGDYRGNNLRKLEITPRANPPEGQGPLGVGLSPFAVMEFKSLPEKIFSGPIYSVELTRLTFMGFGRLLTDVGNRNFEQAGKQVGGPVAMAFMTRDILNQGSLMEALIPYTYFVAILSLTLAIMNVLPVPALDGGRLFFLILEAITRKKVHVNVERYIHNIGFAILLSLILLITYSDIQKNLLR